MDAGRRLAKQVAHLPAEVGRLRGHGIFWIHYFHRGEISEFLVELFGALLPELIGERHVVDARVGRVARLRERHLAVLGRNNAAQPRQEDVEANLFALGQNPVAPKISFQALRVVLVHVGPRQERQLLGRFHFLEQRRLVAGRFPFDYFPRVTIRRRAVAAREDQPRALLKTQAAQLQKNVRDDLARLLIKRHDGDANLTINVLAVEHVKHDSHKLLRNILAAQGFIIVEVVLPTGSALKPVRRRGAEHDEFAIDVPHDLQARLAVDTVEGHAQHATLRAAEHF